MRRAIYAHLQVWDPLGQMKLDEGLRYGGQTMLFVLAADGLAEGLLKLMDAVAQKGLGFVRLIYAGYTDGFEPDHFPFEVDIATMTADALETGRICAIGPYTYAPTLDLKSEDVMLACVDLLGPDLGEAAPRGGAICLAAMRGSVADGLRALLEAARADGQEILSLEDVKDASEHSEVFDFETSVEELVKRARVAPGPVFSDLIEYQRGG